MKIRIPVEFKKRCGQLQIKAQRLEAPAPRAAQKPLLVSLALARAWQRAIDTGKYQTITALAAELKLDYNYVARLMNLNVLDPQIISDIVNGVEPSGTSLEKLTRATPYSWDEQRRKYGWPQRKATAEPETVNIAGCPEPVTTPSTTKPVPPKPTKAKAANASRVAATQQPGLFDNL